MSFTAYATPDDLTAWMAPDTPPANPTRYLRSATILVALACFRDPYTDQPTDQDAAALNDATCAQAATWTLSSIDPATLGIGSGPVKKASILTGDVERDTTGMLAAQQAAVGKLCPESVAILTAAGLIYQPVPVGADATDQLPQWGQPQRWWPTRDLLSDEIQWAPYDAEWLYE